MDGDVGRVRTERIYTLPTAGRQGRRSHEEQQGRFELDGDDDADDASHDEASEPPHNEHGSVGHPDDDEAGRNLDITG